MEELMRWPWSEPVISWSGFGRRTAPACILFAGTGSGKFAFGCVTPISPPPWKTSSTAC
jgi:hypothetical protein